MSRRRAEPAERVVAGQPVLEVISDREGFEVETSVPETLVDALALGSTHRILLPALGAPRARPPCATSAPSPAPPTTTR